MKKGISKQPMQELTGAIRQRYALASIEEKARILDEFVAMTGYHRKHAIRLLGSNAQYDAPALPGGKLVYDEAVKEALIVRWEAADMICGKRLKAVLPTLIEAMERHGHLDLDPEVRNSLLCASASTIDRLLAPVHQQAKGQRRSAVKKASKQIPVRTFSDWDEPAPGELETDFVVHCGSQMSGLFIYSFVATDVCSGWTEAIPLLAREQSLVVEGIDVICSQFPVPVIGLNSDNDSAFINETLLSYCERKKLKFTRSRPYQKNDQAWIEQKNGAVIRRFVGHDRFSGVVAGQVHAQLYQAVRLYVNYFQPSFKLREKTREGARVERQYFKPATRCHRFLDHDIVSEEDKNALISERSQLDPLGLLHRIRDGQAALATIASPESAGGPGRESLDELLAQLPRL